MNFTISSLKRPVTTVMIFLCIAVVGIISTRLLPLEFFPELDAPFVVVNVPYPGSTPEEIEREITRPIEEVLATISDVKNMRSYSRENATDIVLEFDWGVNTDVKALETAEKMDGILHLLPEDMERYFIFKFNTSDMSILTLRLSSERDLSNSYDMLNRNIKRRLERIEGISRVTLYGVEQKEIRIQLLSDRLASHKVDVRSLVNLLMNSNLSLTAGKITDGNTRFSVRPIGEFKRLEDYGNIIVGANNLRLSDVAHISYGQPVLDYGRHLDRKYAIGLDIFKESGANVVEVTERVLAEIDEIKKNPEMTGISIYEMDNQADGIISSLMELLKSGILGAILATLVLYVFLRRWATTFMVTLAVPISLLVTLACMYFLNVSLNILTMMGLLLAVGMLVDNAVVATESIHRHQEKGEEIEKATVTGVKEISMAITAGTLTSIIVFLPNIISAKDQVSIWLKHVAIALCIALVASLILAQSIIPLLASRFQHQKNNKKNTVIDKLIAVYGKLLAWTLEHRKWTVLIIILIIFSIVIPGKFVKFDMFPDQDSDRRLRLFYHINSSYTLDEVENAVDVIEKYLYENKEKFEIESVYSYYQGNYASSTIMLTKDDEAYKSQTVIQEEIRKNLPEIAVGKPGFERSGSIGGENGISIQLIGKSSQELVTLSKELAWTLSNVPGLVDVRSEAETGEKEIRIKVDRERSRRYGFSAREVANVVSAAIRGVRLRKFKTREGEVDVRLEFKDTDRQNLENLQNVTLFNNDHRQFTLATLADFTISRGPQEIRRNNRVTGININANLKDLTVGEAKEKISEVMKNYNLPAGYSWNYGQRFNYEEEATKTMLTNMLLALALIYLVMAALFESLVFPAGIWSSIIFAIIGVYWFFLITGSTMNVMSMIGILILIGVVVNNGIVLIDHILHYRQQGLSRNKAILLAGEERLRPIIMTAATTIFSLLPLTIVKTEIGGSGGPPYFPMARAIVGGLTFSTFVTLLILPTIYILLDNLRNWSKRLIHFGVKDVIVTKDSKQNLQMISD